jgi:hypothetical protein
MARLLLLGAICCLSLPAQAWRGQIGKWNTTNVGFRVDARGASTIADGSDVTAIRNAIESWNSVSCATTGAVYLGDVQTNDPRVARDGNNNVWFEARASRWPHGSGTLGITSTNFQGSGCNGGGSRPYAGCHLIDADVQFNAVSHLDRWSTADQAGRNRMDIESIAVHELGHAMGIDHPCENCTVDAVMTPAYVGYPFRHLRQDDVNALCGIYPGQQGGIGWGCTRNTDCTHNRCVDDGVAQYCTIECGTCPTGYDCRAHEGRELCLRSDALAEAAGQGEACVGRPCETGLLCLGDENDARCYTDCGGGAHLCPGGTTCRQFDGNNQTISVCIDGGNTAEGESCNSLYACAAGLECAPLGNRYLCRRACTSDAQCPDGSVCQDVERVGIDTVKVCGERNTALEAEDCSSKRCADGLTCLYFDGARTCYRNCASRADCSGGMDCVRAAGGAQVCAPAEPMQCGDDSDCAVREVCIDGECEYLEETSDLPDGSRCGADTDCANGRCALVAGTRICAKACDPRVGHYQCSAGNGCALDDEGRGHCVPGADSGDLALGDFCTDAARCAQGICGPEGAEQLRCLTWCGADATCPTGFLCHTLDIDPGVCVPDTRERPEVNALGCTCSGGGSPLDGLLIVGFVGLLALRRRRV